MFLQPNVHLIQYNFCNFNFTHFLLNYKLGKKLTKKRYKLLKEIINPIKFKVIL